MFFILGFPRSGTKLLRNCLNCQNKIFIPEVETEFYYSFRAIYLKNSGENIHTIVHELDKFVNETAYSHYLKLEQNRIVCKDNWISYVQKFDGDLGPSIFFIGMIIASQKQEDYGKSTLIGDKSPSYLYIIDDLIKDFPSAKFIFIHRDPLDVINSNNVAWGKSLARTAMKWSTSNKSAFENLLRCNVDIFELSYEKLSEKPDKIIEDLTTFLGTEYDPNWAEKLGESENLGRAKGVKGIAKLKSNNNKYNFLLNRIIISIVYETANLLGYKKYKPVPNSKLYIFFYYLISPILVLTDVSSMVIFDIKRIGIYKGILFRYKYYFRSGRTKC